MNLETGRKRDRLRALVVDDAPDLAALVEGLLTKEGFEVETVGDGETALERVRELDPDIVVLDVALPGIDGIETCLRLRAVTDAYVLMLTARDEEADRVIGLSAGADDYLVKPFSSRELVARVRALLRRPRAGASPELRRFEALVVDVGMRTATVDGVPVHLTKTQFDLLDALSARPRTTMSRAQLLELVWGPRWYGDDHVVDVHMSALRRKLGDDPRAPKYIETVRGFGFRMVTRDRTSARA